MDSNQSYSVCKAVNPDGTLYEFAARDIWQSEVVTLDGATIGRAVRQIVEPRTYTVRYLIVYDPDRGRRLLLPASLITGAAPGTILCNLTAADMPRIPAYEEEVSHDHEVSAYRSLGLKPHWEEEGELPPPPPEPMH